ncbi:hypothetical protein Godav_023137 [Gossypium davidsonii]|uniref:Uncharacterized protein n=2 Tax=Gossypium TaxID=3633 RepID=A0A7J8SSA1_GOSDV|nr:hypothetical protein [Gossypium davidsonii]MBA0664129.1 hypothetical protein [Gossypium klotzschianum]
MSCFILMSQCMFKASLLTSTTERPTDYPNSTAFIHATASAAKEVEMFPVGLSCPKCTSKNSAKLIGMVVKELGHLILDV